MLPIKGLSLFADFIVTTRDGPEQVAQARNICQEAVFTPTIPDKRGVEKCGTNRNI